MTTEDKEEIKRGMKMSRMVHDSLLNERFAKKGETSSGVKIEVGTTQPTDTNVIWINTTNYWGV